MRFIITVTRAVVLRSTEDTWVEKIIISTVNLSKASRGHIEWKPGPQAERSK